MSDADVLIEQLRSAQRDEVLWTQFYRQLHPAIYMLAFHLCRGNKDLAQDLVQESFLRFITSHAITKTATATSATAYLRAIARNLFRDQRRKEFEHPTVSTDTIPSADLERALDRSIGPTLSHLDLSVLPNLRPADQRLLHLLLQGHTLSEVAAALELTYTAAAVRAHRLRKHLRLECKEISANDVLQDKEEPSNE